MNKEPEMEKYSQLTVILAIVAGLVLATPATLNQSFAYTASAEKKMLGHFTLVVKDEFGNIKDYLEFDNTITDEGDGCVGNLVFGGSGAACAGGVVDAIGVSDCDAAGTGDANNADCAVIGDTTTQFDDTAADIGDHCDDAGEVTKTYTDRITDGTAANVEVEATFDNTELTFPYTAKEAGILNGCLAGDQLFAIKAFANVSLSGSDTLTVKYKVSFTG
ncbi:MAG: hypothetical protein ACE5J2_07415 [Nitrososphaerales archaeon]